MRHGGALPLRRVDAAVTMVAVETAGSRRRRVGELLGNLVDC